MKTFDKHIRDKMSGMEVSPPPKLKSNLQQHYPKQGFVKAIKPFAGGVAVVAAISLIVFFAIQMTNNSNPAYSPEPLNTEAYQTSGNTNVINPNPADKTNPGQSVEKAMLTDNAEDKQTGCKSTYCTYQNKIEIPIDLKQYNLLFTDDGLSTNQDKQNTKLEAEKLGDYLLIFASKSDNRIDTIVVSFMAQPEMPDLIDTLICGLNFTINSASYPGEFTLPEGLSMKHTGTDLTINAEGYKKYALAYSQTDAIGTFNTNFVLEFIPANMPEVQIVKAPRCYLDNAVIQIDIPQDEKSTIALSDGTVEELENHEYRLNFAYIASERVFCYITYHQKHCELHDTLVFELPIKPNYDLLITQPSCNEKASLSIDDLSDNTMKAFLNQEAIAMQKTIYLKPGDYQLQILDKNACVVTEQFSIEEQSALQAGFDFETALDGMSVRITNHTKGLNEFDTDVRYQWYVNGDLVSELEAPILELTQISNTIRLHVKKGFCEDELIISDIQPDKDLIRTANFFTPNGDGQFDEFKVLVDPSLTGFKGKIFNRAGQLIYEWTGINAAWDGKFSGNQNAAEGVYFYAIQAVDSTGRIIEKRGTIQLIRD